MAISMPIDATEDELQEVADMVRMILRDRAQNNILLGDVQFTDAEIKQALRLAVSDYNAMPPISTYGWRDLPEAILILGACRWLMLSESFLQVRNQVSVQTDGLGVVGIDDKNQLYASMAQQLANEFLQRAREVKTAANLANAYGTLSSGYSYVSRFRN